MSSTGKEPSDAARLDSLLDLARELRNQGKVKDSLAIARKAKAENADSARAHHEYAVFLSECGESNGALAAFREGARKFSKEFLFPLAIALEMGRLNRTAEAIRWARRGVALAPNDHRAYERLSSILAGAGRHEEAIELLKGKARLRNKSPWALGLLGETLCRAGRYDAAFKALRRYLAQHPDDNDLRQHLVVSAEHLEKFRSAAFHAGKLWERIKDEPGEHYEVGTDYLSFSVPRFAVAHLARAAQLDPENARAWCNLAAAELLFQRQDYAEFAAQNAVRLEPSDPYGWCNLGDALSEQERFEEAVQAYESAVRVDGAKRSRARSRLRAVRTWLRKYGRTRITSGPIAPSKPTGRKRKSSR